VARSCRRRTLSLTTTVLTLVRDNDQFEAVILPALPKAQGTHELRYLWNKRPFISQVFQRGSLETLLNSVRQFTDELVRRGWRLVTEPGGASRKVTVQ
jgi:hypothetical protein